MSIDEKLKGWIFQGNPLRFDVDTYLRNWNPILWTIGPAGFAKKMSIGDYAFIWRSDGMVPKSGGIVALGIIISQPSLRQDNAPHLWKIPPADALTWRAEILLVEVRLTPEEGMILRTELEKHRMLSSMWILHWRNQTTYPLSPEQTRMLLKWWFQGEIYESGQVSLF